MRKRAIYAGTFDPITFGHLDLIERAANIFDELTLAVVRKPGKNTLFCFRERLAMARQVVGHLKNVTAVPFGGLLVEFARKNGVAVLVRGLRAYSDFEYEFQMALANRKLAPMIETIFLMPKETHSYFTSSVVREVAVLGGDISGFVPACVAARVAKRLGRKVSEK